MAFILRLFIRFLAIIGFIVLVFGLIGAYTVFKGFERKEIKLPDEFVLLLNFDQRIRENTQPDPAQELLYGRVHNFRYIIDSLEKAKNDSRVKGLVIRFYDHNLGLAEIQEFRRSLADYVAAGKSCFAHADTLSESLSGLSSYYLLSPCTQINLQPVGQVPLTGFYQAVPFLKKAFDKAGIKPDFEHFGKYKSFPEMFEQDYFTPAHLEMQLDLMNQMSERLVKDIAQDRQINIDTMHHLYTNGPYTDEESLNLRLIDQVIGYNDLMDQVYTDERENSYEVDIFDYAYFVLEKSKGKVPESQDNDKSSAVKIVKEESTPADQESSEPAEDKPILSTAQTHVALIYAYGDVARASSADKAVFDQSRSINPTQIENAVWEAIEDESIKAIILRVDSPGGSPVASESIRQSLMLAKNNEKPVIVSIGNLGASGGFWFSMAGNQVVAEASSIVGSIGAFGGKFTGQELLEKIGVNFGEITTGGTSGISSVKTTFSPEERERFRATMSHTYDQFVTLVAESRNLPLDQVKEIAQGRAWTGEQALEYKLIDALGGIDVAKQLVKDELGLADEAEIVMVRLPKPLSPWEQVARYIPFASNTSSQEASISVFSKDQQNIMGRFSTMMKGFFAVFDQGM